MPRTISTISRAIFETLRTLWDSPDQILDRWSPYGREIKWHGLYSFQFSRAKTHLIQTFFARSSELDRCQTSTVRCCKEKTAFLHKRCSQRYQLIHIILHAPTLLFPPNAGTRRVQNDNIKFFSSLSQFSKPFKAYRCAVATRE